MRCDAVVLGAGIVGVATALNLQARGRDVAIVDRGGAGEGTSYGNAGVMHSNGVAPVSFPQDLRTLLNYALNNRRDARYTLPYLFAAAPALLRYWRSGRPGAVLKSIQASLGLFERSVEEHEKIAGPAGVLNALRRDGYIEVFRSERARDEAFAAHETLASFNLRAEPLDRAAVLAFEPHIGEYVIGGLRHATSPSLANPLALTRAYLKLFEERGGRRWGGDARSLSHNADGSWSLATTDGALTARNAVVALGPWSDQVFGPLGYKIPLFVKRGYHQHYRVRDGARLNRPLHDMDGGYLIAPMEQGLRVTTGVELASREAPATPIQLGRIEPWIRELFPALGDRVEAEPWMGRRPCLPDMLPIIGPAPRHKGLWFCFGHNHYGLTLAASSGRLIAEMMIRAEPFLDPAPFAADRF